MTASRLNLIAFVAVIAIGIVSNSLYIVNERERAVLLKFGVFFRTDVQPGLHFKLPIVNDVKRFEARLMTLDSRPQRYLTAEKKGLIVDSYVKWRVANVDRYYTATGGDELEANRLLTSRVDNGLRNKFGERTVYEVVSGERDQLMAEITRELDNIAKDELGIEIVDVRVKAVDLPGEVSNAVYSRMASEREREARELRSRVESWPKGLRRTRIAKKPSSRPMLIVRLRPFVVKGMRKLPVFMQALSIWTLSSMPFIVQ